MRISPYVYVGLVDSNGDYTVGVEVIIDACCDVYGIDRKELLSKSRKRHIVECRNCAVTLIKIILEMSLTEAGRLFGDKDHSTVIHAMRRCGEWLQYDEVFAKKFNKCLDAIPSLFGKRDAIKLQIINYSNG